MIAYVLIDLVVFSAYVFFVYFLVVSHGFDFAFSVLVARLARRMTYFVLCGTFIN